MMVFGMKSSAPGKKIHSLGQLQNIINCRVYGIIVHMAALLLEVNTDGGMQDIYVTDCNYIGTDVGIRVKSNPGRGGLVKDIYIDNITMSNIQNEAILFTTYYEDVPAGKSAKNVNTSSSERYPSSPVFISAISNAVKLPRLFLLPACPINLPIILFRQY